MAVETTTYRAAADFQQLRREARQAVADLQSMEAQGVRTANALVEAARRANQAQVAQARLRPNQAYAREIAAQTAALARLRAQAQQASSANNQLNSSAQGAAGGLRAQGGAAEFLASQLNLSNLSALALGTALVATAKKAVGMGIAFNQFKENSLIAFSTILKDGEKAADLMDRIIETARDTPFETNVLVESVRQLLAYGFSLDQVLTGSGIEAKGLVITIGSAVSAMGKGQEMFDQVARAFGQMFAKGKVSAEELRQLAEGGIPVYQILQEELGLTAEAVGEIGKSGVTAEQGIAALQRGLDKRFGGAMAAQAKTFTGIISTLKDNITIGLGAATEGLFKKITQIAGGVGAVLTDINIQAEEIGIAEAIARQFPLLAPLVRGIAELFTNLNDVIDELNPAIKGLAEGFGAIALAGLTVLVKTLAVAMGLLANIVEAIPEPLLEAAGAVTALAISSKLLAPLLIALQGHLGRAGAAALGYASNVLFANLATGATGPAAGAATTGLARFTAMANAGAGAAGRLGKGVLGSIGSFMGFGAAAGGAAIAAGGVTVAIGLLIGAYFLYRNHLENIRERTDSARESSDKLAESLGIQLKALKDVNAEAGKGAEQANNAQFVKDNQNLIEQLRELRELTIEQQERQANAVLLEIGFRLVQKGADPNEVRSGLQRVLDESGLDIPLNIETEDLTNARSILESFAGTAERIKRDLTAVTSEGGDTDFVIGEENREVIKGFAKDINDLIQAGRIGEASAQVMAMGNAFEQAGISGSALTQLQDLLADEIAKTTGYVDFSTSSMSDYGDMLRQVASGDVKGATDDFRRFSTEVIKLVDGGYSLRDAITLVNERFPQFAGGAMTAADAIDAARTAQEKFKAQTEAARAAIGLQEDQLESLVKALGSFIDIGAAISAASSSLKGPADVLGDMMKGIAESDKEKVTDGLKDQVDAAKKAMTEAKKAAKGSSAARDQEAREAEAAYEKIKDTYDDARKHPEKYVDAVKTTVSQVIKSLEAQVGAQTNYQTLLNDVYTRAAAKFGPAGVTAVNAIRDMGAQGIPILEALATSSETEFGRVVTAMNNLGPEAQFSMKQFQLQLDTQIANQAAWAENIRILFLRGYSGIAQALVAEGPKAATAAAEIVKMSDKELAALEAKTARAGADSAVALDQQLKVMATIASTGGKSTVSSLATGMGISEPEVLAIINQLLLDIELLPKEVQIFLKAFADTEAIDIMMGKVQALNATLPSGSRPYAVAGKSSHGGSTINAKGNLLMASAQGLITQRFAGGGFSTNFTSQSPRVRRYSGERGVTFGERGSGPWEAFISGRPSIRQRSVKIWEETGKMLGTLPQSGSLTIAMPQFKDGGVLRTIPQHRPASYTYRASKSDAPSTIKTEYNLPNATIVANDPLDMAKELKKETRRKAMATPLGSDA